ncbi:MAG TPA: hypothetical protein VK217_08945 [Acidimicrobiales bacterium]|nr:hypothetical protein [Acidimicrobiales bacterium]
MPEERSVYEVLLDCLVYAPLGAAIVAAEEVPRLAERGREGVEKQVAVARLIGRFAVAESRRRLGATPPRPARGQAEQEVTRHRPTSARGGPVAARTRPVEPAHHGSDGHPHKARESARPSEDSRSPRDASPEARATGHEAAAPHDPRPATLAPPGVDSRKETPPEAAATNAAGRDLAIPAYDTLAASQVVERLASLTPLELEAVRRHESATRRRRTVLHRIAQLNSERDGATA